MNPALVGLFAHTALLEVPLSAGGEAIGVLILGETRGPRRFTEEEVQRAVGAANQISIAISNARLYEETRRRVHELALMHELSRAISSTLDLDLVLDAAADSLVRLVRSDGALVFLYDADQARLYMAAGRPAPEETERHSFTLKGGGPVVDTFTERRPLRFESVDAAWVPGGGRSLLCLPLLVRDEAVGVAVVYARQPRAWMDSEIERTMAVARQASVGVENARLYADLKISYAELERTQEEFVKRERLAALGELSAVVAHEVRNPLGVIFNSLGSLQKLLEPKGDAAILLRIMGEEADRLNRMVGDLLDFARPMEPTLHPEPLDRLVEEVVHSVQKTQDNQAVRVEVLPGRIEGVPMDARLIRQALVNLLVNAYQAMGKGGVLRVSTALQTIDGRRMATIEVSDTGVGMAPEVQERMFLPFFTTKASGSGLGLAVVRRIFDAHRAEIHVHSEPGVGTRFLLVLPMQPPDRPR